MTHKRRRFADEDRYWNDPSLVSSKLGNRNFLRDKKREASKARRRAPRTRSSKPAGIDWSAVTGSERAPTISFTPSPKNRSAMIQVLKRSQRDPLRKKLGLKLERKFIRIYSRYRREVETSTGRPRTFDSGFLSASDCKCARRAAELCIIGHLTPVEVLKYWSENLPAFLGTAGVPPLSWLSSSSNVDRVSLSKYQKGEEPEANTGFQVDALPADGNSYADVSKLRPGIRGILEGAGVDTTAMNDRYLMNLQCTADDMAKGESGYANQRLNRYCRIIIAGERSEW